jgi:hypothetical protein
LRTSIVIALTALVCATASWAAGGSFTVDKTATCLNGRKVLTSKFAVKRVLPTTFRPRPVAAITIGFPFASGKQALDSGAIVFDRDEATARRHYSALLALQYASAAQVQGISQAKARAQIRRRISRNSNVLITWNLNPQRASRATVAGCLR